MKSRIWNRCENCRNFHETKEVEARLIKFGGRSKRKMVEAYNFCDAEEAEMTSLTYLCDKFDPRMSREEFESGLEAR